MRFLSFRKLFLRSRIALILVLLALFAAVSARTEEPAVFAISGARIFPVSGAPLEKGTVILRNGIIEAVGAKQFIAELGGVKGLWKELTPEQRRELKRLAEG